MPTPHCHLSLKLEAPAGAFCSNHYFVPDVTLSHGHKAVADTVTLSHCTCSLLANKGTPGEGACRL